MTLDTNLQYRYTMDDCMITSDAPTHPRHGFNQGLRARGAGPMGLLGGAGWCMVWGQLMLAPGPEGALGRACGRTGQGRLHAEQGLLALRAGQVDV